jgi:hypothetical protein
LEGGKGDKLSGEGAEGDSGGNMQENKELKYNMSLEEDGYDMEVQDQV